MIDIGNEFFVVKLSSREDQVRVLSKGPWIIVGHYLSVQSWKLNFDPFHDYIKKMVVWIRLPFFPFEHYQSDILFRIGNLVRKTLKVDHTTEMAQRGKFAHLCIEIDVSKPLVSRIVVGVRPQKVEYKGVGIIYFSCRCIGHEEDSYPVITFGSSRA